MKGRGGVARSHITFLGAWSKPLHTMTDPFIVELLPLREGTIFAQLRDFSHVIMEVDYRIWLTSRSRAAIQDLLQRLS